MTTAERRAEIRQRLEAAIAEIHEAAADCRAAEAQSNADSAEQGEPYEPFECVACKFQVPLAQDITDLLVALDTAVAEARRQVWEPIETAPKDGRDILLTNGNYKRVGNWARLRECWSIDAPPPIAAPTHWAPIPTQRAQPAAQPEER